ncbi:MAG: winged helix-turn-helix domain-containing protein [Prevotella sp.]
MAEKKTTTKSTACKKTAAAATTKRACATKATKAAVAVSISAENVGFRAGDVYQALASEQKALSVKEIAKVANISETEVLLGAGWLLKEGKIKGENDVISLA